MIVWDAITGQERLNFDVGTSAYSVALSPDGKWLAAGTAKGNLHIWNAATGQPERIIPKYTRSHIAFSSDSQRVAFAGNDSATHVRVCDVTTGKDVLVLKGHSGIVWRVCYSPDGTRIASASGDGTVKVWDASTGSELVTLREHNGLIDAVSFRPDGKQIATGGSDGTIKIWDATPLSD